MRDCGLTDFGDLMNFTNHSTVLSELAPILPRSGPRGIIPRNPPGPGPGPPGPPGGGPPAPGPPGGGPPGARPSGGGPPAPEPPGPGPPGGPPGPPAICRPIEWQREHC